MCCQDISLTSTVLIYKAATDTCFGTENCEPFVCEMLRMAQAMAKSLYSINEYYHYNL